MWRAVDNEGEVLNVLVQTKRNKAAALKLMRASSVCQSHTFAAPTSNAAVAAHRGMTQFAANLPPPKIPC
jgi:transposase-like protein